MRDCEEMGWWDRAILIAAFVVLVMTFARAWGGPVSEEINQRILQPSVMVKTSSGSGSGVVFTHGEEAYVLTAAHVVRYCKTVESYIENGDEKKREVYKDVSLEQVLYEEGRKVGHISMLAEIVAYEEKLDLALCKVRKRNFAPSTSVFLPEDRDLDVGIGTTVFHCGSLLGDLGSSSLTNGIVSAVGRVLEKDQQLYDQTNAASFPGSSGGVVFTAEGFFYCGMVLQGAGESFVLYRPARVIRTWLRDKTAFGFVVGVPSVTTKEAP